jgi:hypothetical protein
MAQQRRHFMVYIYFLCILKEYKLDLSDEISCVTLNGTVIVNFELENAPYLEMYP